MNITRIVELFPRELCFGNFDTLPDKREQSFEVDRRFKISPVVIS